MPFAPPNIILILADDMGYGDFGCFNYGASRTPTLDHFVNDGLCLTQHYSASPVCAPARASLMTGRYPHRTGEIDTLETRGLDRLALRELTIAELLKRAGYATGLVGKWHNGAYDPRYHPNQRGFDEFAGFSGGWQPYYQWNLDRNGSVSRGDGRYLTNVSPTRRPSSSTVTVAIHFFSISLTMRRIFRSKQLKPTPRHTKRAATSRPRSAKSTR